MSKTATETLQELEVKVNEILGYVKNNDMLLKNIANRISISKSESSHSTEKPIAEAPKQPAEQPKPDKSFKQMPGIKSGIMLVARTSIQQKLVYKEDNKPIAMASVEVYKDNGNEGLKAVKTAKTNATGKWTAALEPGEYLLKVMKKETSTKSRIDSQFEIEIPASKEPVNLEDLII